MPDPVVVQAMREFKQGLLMLEAEQMQEMARRWLAIEDRLANDIELLARQIGDMRARGEVVTKGRLYRLDRYRRLLAQARAEMAHYSDYAADLIAKRQELFARLGIDHAYQSVQLSYYPQVGAYFDRLPIEAVEYMVGLTGEGTPLGKVLKARMIDDPQAFERLADALIKGTALGWNPRKTARAMKDGLADGLDKALVIARTEQLRVYREMSRQQYQSSGLVESYRRLCDHSGRVCGACLADEGHEYPLWLPLPDHPQGRCTAVPSVKGMPALSWLSGEDWLRTQDAEVAISILGPGRYKLWQAGQLDFTRLVTRTQSDVWGESIHPTPLRTLRPREEQQAA